jgi:hypothetical protein
MPTAFMSPAWSLAQAILLALHFGAAALAVLAGGAALALPDASRARAWAGGVFFTALLILSVLGLELAVFGDRPGSPLVAVLIGYFAATAWATAGRESRVGGVFDVGALLVALGAATIGLSLTWPSDGGPSLTYGALATLAGFAAASDLRLILLDAAGAPARFQRLRWRTGAALGCASFSMAVGPGFQPPGALGAEMGLGLAAVAVVALLIIRVASLGRATVPTASAYAPSPLGKMSRRP